MCIQIQQNKAFGAWLKGGFRCSVDMTSHDSAIYLRGLAFTEVEIHSSCGCLLQHLLLRGPDPGQWEPPRANSPHIAPPDSVLLSALPLYSSGGDCSGSAALLLRCWQDPALQCHCGAWLDSSLKSLPGRSGLAWLWSLLSPCCPYPCRGVVERPDPRCRPG